MSATENSFPSYRVTSRRWAFRFRAIQVRGSSSGFFDAAPRYLGTSHRQDNVRNMLPGCAQAVFFVRSSRRLGSILGNGGTTSFWDAASFSLIESSVNICHFGEFSSKFVKVVEQAPHLREPEVIVSDPGSCPSPVESQVDTYALPIMKLQLV